MASLDNFYKAIFTWFLQRLQLLQKDSEMLICFLRLKVTLYIGWLSSPRNSCS